jgi:hypothetical protein
VYISGETAQVLLARAEITRVLTSISGRDH